MALSRDLLGLIGQSRILWEKVLNKDLWVVGAEVEDGEDEEDEGFACLTGC